MANVAAFSLSLWEQTPMMVFGGVPEIAIEVLSSSNRASEMMEREEICLRHGGQEFWLVDPKRQSVKVVRVRGYSSLYDLNSMLSSSSLTSSIAVGDNFAR